MAASREPRGKRETPSKRSSPQRRSTTTSRSAKRGATDPPRGRSSSKGASRGQSPGRGQSRGREERPDDRAGPKTWGNVARKGAGRLNDDRPSGASDVFRSAAGLDEGRATETWVRVDEDIRADATHAVARGKSKRVRPAPPREAPGADRFEAVAGASHVPKLGERLRSASRAFERERYTEARKTLKPLAERAPGSAPVRELYGLTLYRLGQWKLAIRELEAFRTITGSTEQLPVLADCYRALRRYSRVDELWQELAAASPSAEAVTEGRIVAAGALADRGELERAIRLLEAGQKPTKRPREHHLRLTYALADVVERAGDIPRARQLFTKVAASDPDFADVRLRLRSLG